MTDPAPAARRGRVLAASWLALALLMLALGACADEGAGQQNRDGTEIRRNATADPKNSHEGLNHTWTGTITWEAFKPSAPANNDGTACLSAAGLPITVPLEFTFDTYPGGGGVVTEGSMGGATCRIFPDGWDKFSSVWEVNDQSASALAGSMTWDMSTVHFELPGEFLFRGDIRSGSLAIDGIVSGRLSYGELTGRWQVARP